MFSIARIIFIIERRKCIVNSHHLMKYSVHTARVGDICQNLIIEMK
jgi:hypothetical protein